MIGKLNWLIKQLLRRIWVRSLLIALFGVVSALAGVFIDTGLPDHVVEQFGGDSVYTILNILASSMLAVTTFSLAIAVQAYAAAANTATPRASRLLQEDATTQNVLATFVGAFLFSLVGIVALSAHAYGPQGRVILFAGSAVVIILVVAMMLKWIDHITRFGRMDDTLTRVEKAVRKALELYSKNPSMGGTPASGPPPENAHPIYPTKIGYVQHMDIAALGAIAEEHDHKIWIADLPGSYVHPALPLLFIEGDEPSDELIKKLRDTYAIRATRSYDQDPRFGLIVLSEIASRALSPAVNDPGTAIDVINRLTRLLSLWHPDQDKPPAYPRLMIPPLNPQDLLRDAFAAIARDGAPLIEVQTHLQRALAITAALQPDPFKTAARRLSTEAEARAVLAFTSPQDIERLRDAIRRPEE